MANLEREAPGQYLLAVDVGLSTGLALFSDKGQLLWYRSHHLPAAGKLKNALRGVLDSSPRPTALILEGGGPLAEIWLRAAERRSLAVLQIHAEQWRQELFYPRQHQNAQLAKRSAEKIARQLIKELGGKAPTSLRHDTAEAILIGYYGLRRLGWLPASRS